MVVDKIQEKCIVSRDIYVLFSSFEYPMLISLLFGGMGKGGHGRTKRV